VVKKIAEANDCGFVCFFNPDTGEIEEAMPEWLEEPESHEDATQEDWEDMYSFENWDQVITINPPETHESFNIMEDFAQHRVKGFLQDELLSALNRSRPFRNFKNLIDESDYRQDWFAYKQLRLEERVWERLTSNLCGDDDTDELPF
jgi:hypothetical protein